MSLYPPDALVRFSRRLGVRAIRPEKERSFKRLFVFWAVYLPLYALFLAGWFWSTDVPLAQMLGPACAWIGGFTIFPGQSAVLFEEGRPLLSAWLGIAWLAATVLATATFAWLAHVWLGWGGVAGAAPLMAVGLAVDAYRCDRGASH